MRWHTTERALPPYGKVVAAVRIDEVQGEPQLVCLAAAEREKEETGWCWKCDDGEYAGSKYFTHWTRLPSGPTS